MTWRENAIRHGIDCSPSESCGLVVIIKGKEVYFPCKNLSQDDEYFVLDPLDYAAAEDKGEVKYVVHSHPTTPAVESMEDKIGCEASALPWYIFNPFTEDFRLIEPNGYVPPLCGRPWVWNHSDCWTLVRDWFLEHGVELKDWDRPATPDLFNDSPMFDNCWNDTGFYLLSESEPLLPGDCLLMALYSNKLNHVAVYLGNNQILHHVRNRLSTRDQYNQRWKDCTGRRLRYHNREALRF